MPTPSIARALRGRDTLGPRHAGAATRLSQRVPRPLRTVLESWLATATRMLGDC